MIPALRYAGQAAAYLAFVLVVGYFSNQPLYTHVPPDLGLVKFSLSHQAKPKGECHRLTREELDRLAPNMRRPVQCPRERLPLLVEMELDGRVVYSAVLRASGVSRDGPARVYQRIQVAPGEHRLAVRMRDSDRTDGFDYTREETITVRARQNFVIDFRPDAGVFVFR